MFLVNVITAGADDFAGSEQTFGSAGAGPMLQRRTTNIGLLRSRERSKLQVQAFNA
jgi:hypothetical protein